MSKVLGENIHKYINGLLVLVVGYLLNSQIQDIKDNMKVVQTLQVTQAGLVERVNGIQADLNDFKGRFATQQRIEDAKDEDEITLNKLKKK